MKLERNKNIYQIIDKSIDEIESDLRMIEIDLDLIKMANYIYIVTDNDNDSIESIIKAATEFNKTIVKYKVQKCQKKHKQ